MIRIEFSDADIAELKYERFHHPEPRVQKKCEVLFLKSQGLSHGMICKLCGISYVTLAEYLKQYQGGRINRLKLNLYKGKENLLASHAESIEEYLYKHPPRSAKEAQAVIEEKTGIKRCLTQVREFLKTIGFKYRKVSSIPGKVMDKEKIQEQEDFKEQELIPRLKEAEQGKREIFLWMPPTSYTKHI